MTHRRGVSLKALRFRVPMVVTFHRKTLAQNSAVDAPIDIKLGSYRRYRDIIKIDKEQALFQKETVLMRSGFRAQTYLLCPLSF